MIVLITLGEKGSYCLNCINNEVFTCPAKATLVSSTVGAGDSFSAAFLANFLLGSSIPECLEVASKVSSFVVSQVAAIPDYNFEDFI